MNLELPPDMQPRGTSGTNERALGFDAHASTHSRRSGRKTTMNQTIATGPTKADKLSAADFFFRRGGGGSQSDDEGNAFSDDEDVAWATGRSKRSLNSVIAPKISKIDDDDIDFFSEVETDSESVSNKEKKKKKKKKSKESDRKDKKKSKDKKSKKKKSKDKKKQQHDSDVDLSERSESDSVYRSQLEPDGVKLCGGLSASPVRKPKKRVPSTSEEKTNDELVTPKKKSSKSEKKDRKSTKGERRASDKSTEEKKDKSSKSSKRTAEEVAEPETPTSPKEIVETLDIEKDSKSSNASIGLQEEKVLPETPTRNKSSVVKSMAADDTYKSNDSSNFGLDFNASFVDLSNDFAQDTPLEECPDTPTKNRRSTSEISKRGRRSLSRGRPDSRAESTKRDDSVLQSPEKSSASSTERTSTTSHSSSWGDFESSSNRAPTVEFPGDLVVSPDCARQAKKSVGKAFELDSFADLQTSFADFQSSSTEFNANFESEDVLMERAKEEAKRQMLDQSRKGPVRVRVSIRRRNRDPASPGSKPKPLKPITVPPSPSKKDEESGVVEPPKEGKAKRRPSLDDHFDAEPKAIPTRKHSSATIHGGRFSPANVDNYVSSSSSLPDIRKKIGAVASPNSSARGVLHREDSANRLRSSQDLAGVVDEFLRSGRSLAPEEPSDGVARVGRKGPRRSSSGLSLLTSENQDQSHSSLVKTPKRRSSTGKLLGVGKKTDLTSPDTHSKGKRRLSFVRSSSKFRQLQDDEK